MRFEAVEDDVLDRKPGPSLTFDTSPVATAAKFRRDGRAIGVVNKSFTSSEQDAPVAFCSSGSRAIDTRLRLTGL